MSFNLKRWLFVIGYCTLTVTGAPNLKPDLHEVQTSHEAENLVNCKPSQAYEDLTTFTINPRNIADEDTACLSLRMFKEMDFIQHFNLPVDVLSRFILHAKNGYRDVPYHSWSHGFSVLHFTFAVLKNSKLIEKHHLTQLEALALMTAAMCHDIDHRGTNNKFQEEINNSLAQKYASQGSIMERHHIDVTLNLLNKTDLNFVAHLKEDELYYFQDLIKQIILATDLSIHFKLLPEEKKMATAGFECSNNKHRALLRSNIISCADLSDQVKDWATIRKIAKLLYSEFFAQGEEERKLGFVPTAMMDQTVANIPQLNIDFISNVVIPDFQVLLTLYPETQICMDNINKNLEYWKKSIPYFEEQTRLGRRQLDILLDNKLDSILTFT